MKGTGMPLILGMILGGLLLVGAVYISDSMTTGAPQAQTKPAAPAKPMVNWDVVSDNWHDFTGKVRHTWQKLKAS
jgi:hypothetical protein